jgi:Zn finger protein HypA/HybF involved in hydrogenase expression
MVIICRVCQRIVSKVGADMLCDQCGGYDKSSVLPNWRNLWEVNEKCMKCTFPLHSGMGQDERFCPNCVAERIQIQRGRDVLAKAKERASARASAERLVARKKFITDTEDDESDEPPYWPDGIAL